MANEKAKAADTKKKQKSSNNNKKSTAKKEFFLVRWAKGIANYFSSAYKELKKVSWPTRKELFKSTWAVLIIVIAFTIVVYLFDIIFGYLTGLLYNLV